MDGVWNCGVPRESDDWPAGVPLQFEWIQERGCRLHDTGGHRHRGIGLGGGVCLPAPPVQAPHILMWPCCCPPLFPSEECGRNRATLCYRAGGALGVDSHSIHEKDDDSRE